MRSPVFWVCRVRLRLVRILGRLVSSLGCGCFCVLLCIGHIFLVCMVSICLLDLIERGKVFPYAYAVL